LVQPCDTADRAEGVIVSSLTLEVQGLGMGERFHSIQGPLYL